MRHKNTYIRHLKSLNNNFSAYTPETAYWFGFLMADGNINQYGKLQVMTSTEIQPHIEKLANFISSDIIVRSYTANTRCHFQINHPELSMNLFSLGMMPRKTYEILQIPEVFQNELLIHHYIRGYFDGDGWISICASYNKQYNKYYPKYVLGICSYHKKTLENIQRHLPVVSRVIKKKNQHLYELLVTKRNDVLTIYNWLYQDSHEDTRLLQKYNKFQKILNVANIK